MNFNVNVYRIYPPLARSEVGLGIFSVSILITHAVKRNELKVKQDQLIWRLVLCNKTELELSISNKHKRRQKTFTCANCARSEALSTYTSMVRAKQRLEVKILRNRQQDYK